MHLTCSSAPTCPSKPSDITLLETIPLRLDKLLPQPAPISRTDRTTGAGEGGECQDLVDPVSYTHLDVYKRQVLHREHLQASGLLQAHR